MHTLLTNNRRNVWAEWSYANRSILSVREFLMVTNKLLEITLCIKEQQIIPGTEKCLHLPIVYKLWEPQTAGALRASSGL